MLLTQLWVVELFFVWLTFGALILIPSILWWVIYVLNYQGKSIFFKLFEIVTKFSRFLYGLAFIWGVAILASFFAPASQLPEDKFVAHCQLAVELLSQRYVPTKPIGNLFSFLVWLTLPLFAGILAVLFSRRSKKTEN